MVNIMRRYFWYLAISILPFFYFSCGIEEYFYLPQVPVPERTFNTGATVYLPDKPGYSSLGYYYYKIYYRIYLSDNQNLLHNDSLGLFPASYSYDYNLIALYTNPSNMYTNSSINQFFIDLHYHELKFENQSNQTMMPPNSTLTIMFPTGSGFPVASVYSGLQDILLQRSISNPSSNLHFVNSFELSEYPIDSDVAAGDGSHAYVSMYIVAVGFDTVSFTEVYSKPTFINLFKLPEQ